MRKSDLSKGLSRFARIGGVAAFSLLVVGATFGVPVKKVGAEAGAVAETTKRLVVNINDLDGRANFNSEDIREDLLRAAFYDASRRADWLGDYDFNYNVAQGSPVAGSLEFNVLNWRRSRTGMFEFTVAANYWDMDGKKVNLGTFFGMRSNLSVFNAWDVGDQFSGSAEDAFRDSLRKLKKVVVES